MGNNRTVQLAKATFPSPGSQDFGEVLPDKEIKIPSKTQRMILSRRFKKAMLSEETINDLQLKTAFELLEKQLASKEATLSAVDQEQQEP